MDKRKLHPVDDYFISKVNEGSKNVTYNKANWDQLSARLDNHSIKPKSTGKFNFLGKNIYLLSLFISTVVLIPSIIYLSKNSPDVAHFQKIDSSITRMKSGLEEIKIPLESNTIPIEAEEILLENKEVSKSQQEQKFPTPIKHTETETVVDNIVVKPEKSFETNQIDEKSLIKDFAPSPLTPMKIVKFSLPQVFEIKEIQVESPKDSLFIFW